jgi:hypothetical protein
VGRGREFVEDIDGMSFVDLTEFWETEFVEEDMEEMELIELFRE